MKLLVAIYLFHLFCVAVFAAPNGGIISGVTGLTDGLLEDSTGTAGLVGNVLDAVDILLNDLVGSDGAIVNL